MIIEDEKLMKEVCDYYNYDIDKNEFKKNYKKETIITSSLSVGKFAIEFMMLRISEAERDIKEIRKQILENKGNRTRQITSEIKKIFDVKNFILKYGDDKRTKVLLRELENCITDLKLLKKATSKKTYIKNGKYVNTNIRYGYDESFLILSNTSKELLNTTESHIIECINLHINYLLSDLEIKKKECNQMNKNHIELRLKYPSETFEDVEFDYNKENIKYLFNYYFS